MTQDEQWPPDNLIDMMMQLSDGDISVLVGAVTHRASMSTWVGSRNHAFWRELAKLGLLKEDPPIPIEELADARNFSVVKDSVPRLEKLLAVFRKRIIYVKMMRFFETECEPFSRKVVESVKDAGGGTADIIILMGVILSSVLSKSFPQQDCEQVIQAVADLARKRLAKNNS